MELLRVLADEMRDEILSALPILSTLSDNSYLRSRVFSSDSCFHGHSGFIIWYFSWGVEVHLIDVVLLKRYALFTEIHLQDTSQQITSHLIDDIGFSYESPTLMPDLIRIISEWITQSTPNRPNVLEFDND